MDVGSAILLAVLVAIGLCGLLFLVRAKLLKSSFGQQFLHVWVHEAARRSCYLCLFVCLAWAISALALGRLSMLIPALVAGGLFAAVIRWGDRAAEQLLFCILMDDSGGGSGGGEDQAGPHWLESPPTDDGRAAAALLTVVMALGRSGRFPDRLIQRLNRREKRSFWSHKDLDQFKTRQWWKAFLYCAVEAAAIAAGVALVAANLEGGRPLVGTLAALAGLVLLLLAYAGWCALPSRGCFFCGKKATEEHALADFRLRFCSADCYGKARDFWKQIWERTLRLGQTMVLNDATRKAFKVSEEEAGAESVFGSDGKSMLLAAVVEIRLRGEFNLTFAREKRMLWEVARQLHLWRVLLLRSSRAVLFETKTA